MAFVLTSVTTYNIIITHGERALFNLNARVEARGTIVPKAVGRGYYGPETRQVKPISMGVPQGSVIGPLLFNIVSNDIIKSSSKFSFILYADDTTLNSTLDTFGTNQVDIKKSIIIELQTILKWLDVNKLCLNVSKSKVMLFHMPQKIIPC